MENITIESFEALKEQPDLARAAALEICAQHGLGKQCVRIDAGTALVFSVADKYIIKIFPAQEFAFAQNESLFLGKLHGRLPLPTPELHAGGEWQSCPYIVMQKLPGIMLKEVWDELSDSEQIRLMGNLGQIIQALHALPLDLFTEGTFEWHSLIEQQKDDLFAHHNAYGLDPAWVYQIGEYMDIYPIDLHDASQMVPLHTEIMPEHLFVQQVAGRWELCGLIDFEPAMLGMRAYEFCAVGLFFCPGKRSLFRQFLSAYGYAGAEMTPLFSRQLMQMLLLHRYSNLKWFMKNTLPSGHTMHRLGDLEQYWFGV